MTEPADADDSEMIIVYIDPDLEEIVPGFLENRSKDAATLRRALEAKDFNTVRLLGHRMKGDGGGYGFDAISMIGEALEQAAIKEDESTIDQNVAALRAFLANVEVAYRK